MIFWGIFALFFLCVIFTGWAITMESWPRLLVAFGGLFTGVLLPVVAIQIMVLFHG